jgi:hypothetical protein
MSRFVDKRIKVVAPYQKDDFDFFTENKVTIDQVLLEPFEAIEGEVG